MDHLRLLIDALRAGDWKCSLRHALHLAAVLADTYLDDGHTPVGLTVGEANMGLYDLTTRLEVALSDVEGVQGVEAAQLPSWVWPILLRVIEELLKRV